MMGRTRTINSNSPLHLSPTNESESDSFNLSQELRIIANETQPAASWFYGYSRRQALPLAIIGPNPTSKRTSHGNWTSPPPRNLILLANPPHRGPNNVILINNMHLTPLQFVGKRAQAWKRKRTRNVSVGQLNSSPFLVFIPPSSTT